MVCTFPRTLANQPSFGHVLVQEAYFQAATSKSPRHQECWTLTASVISKLVIILNDEAESLRTFVDTLRYTGADLVYVPYHPEYFVMLQAAEQEAAEQEAAAEEAAEATEEADPGPERKKQRRE